MTKLSYSGNTITINGKLINLNYPVLLAYVALSKIIVLFNPDAYIPKFGQFQNLVAIDVEGNTLWTAELPTSYTGDCYYKITSQIPLKALSFQSFECDIDLDTGKIVSKEFVK